MKRLARIIVGTLLLPLAMAIQTPAVEHPGTLPRGAVCYSCHADKISGKSVHSAGVGSCTICHLVQTEGDMATINLAVPKGQICFACHEQSTEEQHFPMVKGDCLDCHDAHSSGRRWLLRESVDVHRLQLGLSQHKRKRQGGK
jgi:predicted CXXCH cytochrome family protein